MPACLPACLQLQSRPFILSNFLKNFLKAEKKKQNRKQKTWRKIEQKCNKQLWQIVRDNIKLQHNYNNKIKTHSTCSYTTRNCNIILKTKPKKQKKFFSFSFFWTFMYKLKEFLNNYANIIKKMKIKQKNNFFSNKNSQLCNPFLWPPIFLYIFWS